MSKKKDKILHIDSDSVTIDTKGGVLTQETIEEACKKASEDFGHVADSLEYSLKDVTKQFNAIFTDQEKLARNKEWFTKNGQLIEYHNLTDDHLTRILALFKKGKFKNRMCHLKGLQQEQLRRKSEAGDILYGK